VPSVLLTLTFSVLNLFFIALRLDYVSPDPIFQDRHVEIDEEPKAASREAYVGQDNGFMDGSKRFDGLEFDHDP